MTPMRWTSQEKWGERTNELVQLYNRLILLDTRQAFTVSFKTKDSPLA